MAQSVVTVRLNGQPYQMGCGQGEEAHIEALAKEVDDIITAVKSDAGQLGDTRLLAMAALILADQKHTLQSGSPETSESLAHAQSDNSAMSAEAEAMLASQLEAMASKLRGLKDQLDSIT
jgi:cell division protein ZapA